MLRQKKKKQTNKQKITGTAISYTLIKVFNIAVIRFNCCWNIIIKYMRNRYSFWNLKQVGMRRTKVSHVDGSELCSPVVWSYYTALRVILQGLADDFMHAYVIKITEPLLCNIAVNSVWENVIVISFLHLNPQFSVLWRRCFIDGFTINWCSTFFVRSCLHGPIFIIPHVI